MFVTPQQLADLQDHLGVDCQAFLPEIIVCATIVLLLVIRLISGFGRIHVGGIALVLTVAALAVAVAQWMGVTHIDMRASMSPKPEAWSMFTGLLSYDNLTIFLRIFLLSFAALIIWLSFITRIPDRDDSADFYVLLLGATLGMMLMASANHLLMVFIGVEMASVPSYALAGFLKGKRQGSEASLKYVVYGGGAAGIMLYGISLLAGRFGTAYLPDLARMYLESIHSPGSGTFDPILVLGTLFILIGIAFKLAAVPFHFWCPDVFEGAAAEVAGFLSVASKGAVLALLGRFVLMLGGVDFTAAKSDLRSIHYFVPALAFLAALTATFGNFAAYMQTNLKRLLAYSTIAHAGYMTMGIATMTQEGVGAVLFYLVAYLFMNLGAFAIVAFLRNQTGSEDLSSFRGLIRRAPILVITLAVFLLSLLGLPPLAGFAAKLQIFSALVRAGNQYQQLGQPALSYTMYTLLVIGGLNTVVSAVYYLKVLKVMILEKPIEEVEGQEPVPLRSPAGAELYAVLVAVAILVIGIMWDPLLRASQEGVDRFQVKGARPAVATVEK